MDVKVCDCRSDAFSKDFKDSVRSTGFAVITNHGIHHETIKKAQNEWRQFFLSPRDYKDSFINRADPNLGYKGFKSEKALGADKADLKEFFHYKPGQSLPDGTGGNTASMFSELREMGLQFLKILGYNECCEESDNTILRTLYYPAMDFAAEPGSVRAAAHEDINFITLLVAASSAGLQVKDQEGKWHEVPHEENSIVVNIGDQLQLASKGLYRSTTHRVVNPNDSKSDRISMPLFIHPHSDTLLADGVTAKEFLAERIAQIYQKA